VAQPILAVSLEPGTQILVISREELQTQKISPRCCRLPLFRLAARAITSRISPNVISGEPAFLQAPEQARLVPVFEPHNQPENEIAQIAITFRVYVRHTRKDGPASIVVLLQEALDLSVDGRIVYGEQQDDGTVQLLWDSPIVVARLAAVLFFDVDGDGVEEIILHAAYPADMRYLGAMSVFDIEGNELSRYLTSVVESAKPHGAVPDLYGYSAADGSCPIVAEAVDFDYSHARLTT
jgi:hypothetical protein